MAQANSKIDRLKVALHSLQSNTYLEVSSPPSCKKRASVALIIRVRPSFHDSEHISVNQVQPNDSASENDIDAFFNQSWVQRGDPELLFIKRATRHGDRWTGHVALPGGKREAADGDDRAASIRETAEEIGLCLTAGYSLFIGNLPQRVVTTSWGQTPLMVLCPFVFLITRSDIPPLRLQPSEVAAVHWVPIRALLPPSLRTYESCDVSDRLTRQRGLFTRLFLQTLLGKMLFPAVRLITAESLYCTSTQEFLPDEVPQTSNTSSFTKFIAKSLPWNSSRITKLNHSLLLWGLTHGIVTDFLDLLPSHSTSALWTWPTFSHWDIQLILWLITYRFRQQRLRTMNMQSTKPMTIIEEGFSATISTDGWQSTTTNETPLPSKSHNPSSPASASATGRMLDGYFRLVRKALLATFLFRLGISATTFTTVLLFLLRRPRAQRVRLKATHP